MNEMAKDPLVDIASSFMQSVAQVPFVRVEAWLGDRLEHELGDAEFQSPPEVYCTATAFQDLRDRGKREIEIRCVCIAGSRQAIGYVYVSEEGKGEIDAEILLEPV